MATNQNDSMLEEWSKRMQESGRVGFTTGTKWVRYSDCTKFHVALFYPDLEFADCDSWVLPGNLNTDQAIERWARARFVEFCDEIIDILGV